MSDQFNKNDDWSNRNWQDAGQFGGTNRGGGGFFGGGGNQGGGFFGGGNNNDNNQGGGGFFGKNNNGKIGGGWMQSKNSMLVIVIVLIIVIIYTFFTQIQMNAHITKSTWQRVKIESTFNSNEDPCYMDEMGVVEDARAMTDACKDFHKQTGVIPYVYFTKSNTETSSEELAKQAEEFYKEIFTDEDHLVIFVDPLDVAVYHGAYAGENARTVIDDEAKNIIFDYLDTFYSQRQTPNQTYMVHTLKYSAERMMTTLPYSKSSLIFGIIVIAVLIIVFVFSIKKKSDETAKKEAEQKNIEKM